MSQAPPRDLEGEEPSSWQPTPAAVLFSAFVCGVARSGAWVLLGHGAGGAWAQAALVELCHWLALGIFVAASLALATWLTNRVRSRRSRRLLYLLIWYLACLALVADPIHGDLTGFAARQTALPARVTLYGGVFLVALLPLGVSSGATLLARRFGWVAAAPLSLIGLLGVLGNGLWLVHDYAGVHLTVALASAGLIAPCCSTLSYPRGTLAVLALPVLGWAALGTPAPVRTLLANETAAAPSPVLEQVRNRLAPAALAADTSTRAHPEWFAPRHNLPPRKPRPGPVAAPVVLLISIDALRADVINSGEYDTRLPTFAKLRKGGASFSSARAPAALTKMSLSSLFRSTYFSQQEWSLRRTDLYAPSRDKTKTLPELLADGGVATRNVRTIAWLTNGPFFRGFQRNALAKDPRSRYAAAEYALPLLEEALDAVAEKPSFIFTHLSDPHAPYLHGRRKESQFGRYLRELEYVDARLRKLLAHLETLGLTDRTYLIVTADHGEEFGEHGAFTHGTTLYDPALRVPLIITGPSVVAREIRENVTTLDLLPTVLDLFDLPTPGAAMGESLLGVALGGAPAFTRPISAETRLMRAWITPDNLKLIWDTRSGRVEAYDLTRDPQEAENLYGRSPSADLAFVDLRAFFAAHAWTKNGYEPPYFR